MTDVCLRWPSPSATGRPTLPEGVDGDYVLSTIHRAENTDDETRLRAIIEGLAALPYPVVLTAHPRLVARAGHYGIDLRAGSLHTIEPLDYPAMVAAVKGARAVVTDSGGLQKEAFLLRTPCTTVRTETEWTETIDLGWNVLALDLSRLTEIVDRPAPSPTDAAPYGDGHAAEATVRALEKAHLAR